MEAKLAAVRGAARMIIANNTPGGITLAAIHGLLAKSGLEVSRDTLIQALRAEHAANGISPGPHFGRWVLGPASVLRWDKPPRELPHEQWAAYQADSAPPGTYIPNMPEDWKKAWKAKLCGQRSHRYDRLKVEVRKTVTAGHSFAQVLVVVMHDGRVRVSANGTADFTPREFAELQLAVAEAREAMRAYVRAHPLEEEAA